MAGKKETVNHPAHYNAGSMEVIVAIDGLGLGFCAGNVLKYIARYKLKNGVEDLKKAAWYLNHLIEQEEKNAIQINGGRESGSVNGRRRDGSRGGKGLDNGD